MKTASGASCNGKNGKPACSDHANMADKNRSMEDANVVQAGETLRLMPERAVFVERHATLLIADTHFGKAATFRAHGIPLPKGGTRDDLRRLTHALLRTGASRLIVLGDLLHSRHSHDQSVVDEIAAWRDEHPALDIDLVRGNHDLHAGVPPEAWRITVYEGALMLPPFVLQHAPGSDSRGYVLAGHTHPIVTLREGRESLNMPCVHFGAAYGTLPAFSSFTAGARVQSRPGDRIFALAGSAVIEVTPSQRDSK